MTLNQMGDKGLTMLKTLGTFNTFHHGGLVICIHVIDQLVLGATLKTTFCALKPWGLVHCIHVIEQLVLGVNFITTFCALQPWEPLNWRLIIYQSRALLL